MKTIEEVMKGMKFKTKAEEIAFVFGWNAAMGEVNEGIEKKNKGDEVETVGDLIRVLRRMPKTKKLRMNVATSYDEVNGWDYGWAEVEVFNATDGVVIIERGKK